LARCLFWLFVSATLVLMFMFARKRFHQVVLLFGISTGLIVVLRLLSLRRSDVSELLSEAYFLLAIAVFYGLVWLGMRYLGGGSRSRSKSSSEKSRR
jgi:hypothetical protein